MKEKNKFKNFRNIGYRYRSMNGRYISNQPQKGSIGRSPIITEMT